MTNRHTTTPSRLPGNDGRWFLKAAGVDTAATELGDVAGDTESTSELVRELWETDPGHGDIATWSPSELSRLVQRKRNFRWSMVGAALLLVAALAAFALWLPGTSERRAAEVGTRYEMMYLTLYEDLAPSQQVLATVTDPFVDIADFGQPSAVVTEMRSNAGDALVLATTRIPSPYPLAPSAPLTRLNPHRDSLSVHATSSEAIARRLGDLLDYHAISERLFAIEELPSDGAGVNLNELSERLAAVAAESTTALDELPEDAAFAEHKAATRAVVTRFSEWQVDYVEALRVDDTAAAEVLVTEWSAMTDELDALFVGALARIRTELDAEIIELATGINQSLDNLEGV